MKDTQILYNLIIVNYYNNLNIKYKKLWVQKNVIKILFKKIEIIKMLYNN